MVLLLLYRIVDEDGSPSGLPRVKVASGLVRPNASRRAGACSRIVVRRQSWTRGGGTKTNTLSAPAVAQVSKPGDPLQIQVEPVVSTPYKQKTVQILEATRSVFRRNIDCTRPETPLRRVFSPWFHSVRNCF